MLRPVAAGPRRHCANPVLQILLVKRPRVEGGYNMATAEADDDDGDGISCCTAAANECKEVTIWRRRLQSAEANDDGDGVCCCTAAANEC